MVSLERCCTTKTDAGKPSGKFSRITGKASLPPAEAPKTIMGCVGVVISQNIYQTGFNHMQKRVPGRFSRRFWLGSGINDLTYTSKIPAFPF